LRAALLAGQAGTGDVMPRVGRSGCGGGLPGTLRRSCREAQKAFTRAYQEAVRACGEGDQAVRAAFAALKRSFDKRGDHWGRSNLNWLVSGAGVGGIGGARAGESGWA